MHTKLNKNIKILAKSAFNTEQLQTKINLKAEGIEIQLVRELFSPDRPSELTYPEIKCLDAENVFNIDLLSKYNIYCVHAPIHRYCNLEYIVNPDKVKILEEVAKIANRIGIEHSRQIIIIVHSELSTEAINSPTFNLIVGTLDILLTTYKHIEIAIENVLPIVDIYQTPLHLANNFGFDNKEMVKVIRERLNTDRVGTVLDICHARVSYLYMTQFCNILGESIKELYSLERYFIENKDYIKLIHLSDITGTGYGKHQHGIAMKVGDKQSENRMKEFIALYNKYNYHCPITLEIEEDDYIKSDGFRSTFELINRYRE